MSLENLLLCLLKSFGVWTTFELQWIFYSICMSHNPFWSRIISIWLIALLIEFGSPINRPAEIGGRRCPRDWNRSKSDVDRYCADTEGPSNMSTNQAAFYCCPLARSFVRSFECQEGSIPHSLRLESITRIEEFTFHGHESNRFPTPALVLLLVWWEYLRLAIKSWNWRLSMSYRELRHKCIFKSRSWKRHCFITLWGRCFIAFECI